jgi:hypothetical protein
MGHLAAESATESRYYYYYYYYYYYLISHFSALAGKYSPIMGFSNQKD